ncbi:hypothetical protein AMS68_000655 [Peltaster fructicola]|uniref:Peroxisomal membrane protein PEX14 n=1 Tax=Peltaster fructicola TaxID=286661 RepID=A0A6H0XKH4_9PEZI|nr:hypothetical protein AMS68_000655 [Peltaster fructicola]
MVREDLIEGAISFLQDPSVASAPVEQRVAFLRSKNLTQEEIDASLARVGQATPSQAASTTATYQYRPPPTANGYQQAPYWAQPPPQVPRRDWRDYFIMATVMGGVGYGLYWTAKRYVYPLIAPPTPPQLEQDKAHIDASFDKAFALLDQLATDTNELKSAEKTRSERLDSALAEVENVIARMKEANEQRELETKRAAREMLDIRDQIPHAIAKERDNTDNKLKELITEMKSLKTLVANRMSGSSALPAARPVSTSSYPTNGTPVETNGANEEEKSTPVLPEKSNASAPLSGRLAGGGKSPAIPAWQLAAKKRSEEAKKDTVNGTYDVSESGTAAEVTEATA